MAKARRSALLAFCRSLPLVTEDVKWGNDLIFSIGGKMFAGFTYDGADATFGCKVAEEDFEAITNIEGIRPAHYAARFHWISVEDPNVLPESEALSLLRGSYDLVKAKLSAKLQRQIDSTAPAPKGGASAEAVKKSGAPKAGARQAGAAKTSKAPKVRASAPTKSAPTKSAPAKVAPRPKARAR